MLCCVQEKEVGNGGAAPRVMSIDDYFMVENDKMEKDPDTGRIVKKTVRVSLYIGCVSFYVTKELLDAKFQIVRSRQFNMLLPP